MVSVGQRVRELREDNDVLQGELAAALHIHQSVLNRIEKGTRPLREEELLGIARFFHVTTDYILGNDAQDTMSPSERNHLLKYRAIGRARQRHVDDLLDSLWSESVENKNR